MTKWQISDVPCVVILGSDQPPVNSITSDVQAKEVMRQSSDCVHTTTEEMVEYMGWEGELLKRYMGLPRNNY
jgi:hypothetical protein